MFMQPRASIYIIRLAGENSKFQNNDRVGSDQQFTRSTIKLSKRTFNK